MYQLTSDPTMVVNLDTGTWCVEGSGYLWDDYQAWLADGNTPLPATTATDITP
jgi:hypothetical protein